MAECAVMQSGSEGVTEKMNVFLGEATHIENGQEVWTCHCMPGYCDGGEYAYYYWPLGALPVVFQRNPARTVVDNDWYDNAGNKYRITTNVFHLKIISWQGDPIGIGKVRVMPMSQALSAEPSAPTGVSGSVIFQLVEDIMSEVSSQNGEMINNLLEQYAVSKSTKSDVTTFIVPCLAALRLGIATGDSFPAFVGASAAAVALTRTSLNMTRDNVAFDGEYEIVTKTLIQRADSGGGEEYF